MIEEQSTLVSPKSMTCNRSRRAFLAAAAWLFAATTQRPNSAVAGVLPVAPHSLRWLAFYGTAADEDILKMYDLVILDPAFQGSIGVITDAGTRVCGYLSLGEVRTSDPLLAYLDPEALLPENPDWPGTRRVDIRDPSWRSLVLDQQIPALLSQGFTGLMFDTLDTPPYLEQLAPAHFRGMRDTAIELVDTIRARWPDLMLVMNRGYALLPDVVQNIDAVIAESLMTAPDLRTGGFTWVDTDQLELQLKLLEPAARRGPPLPILSLDYWDLNDTATIAEIYRRERDLGHHPYVATRLLDQIVPEDR